jgi:hypothetical protein
MIITRDHIKISIFVVLAIAATIIVTSIFKGSKKPDAKLYEQLMAAKDESINILKSNQARNDSLYGTVISEMKSQVQAADSLYTLLVNNLPKYQNVNKSYANIPAHINSISGSNNAIRGEFANY